MLTYGVPLPQQRNPMNKGKYMDKPQPQATHRCLSATNEHIHQGCMHSRHYDTYAK